jgi:hypothetical protein
MTCLNKSACCFYSLVLTLALIASGSASAQTVPSAAMTPCDSVQAINLKWEFKKPPTDSLLHVVVGMVDTTIGDLPEFAAFWKSELRARILDTRAVRCPKNTTVALHLPRTVYAYIAIARVGFEIQFNVYRGQVLERGTKLRYFWDMPAAAVTWSEESLDFKAHTYTKRSNSTFGLLPESLTISAEADKITRIEVKSGERQTGLQYSLVDGKEHFILPDIWGTKFRELNPKDPKDVEAWKIEGEKLYRRAFTNYFRMPASMSEFSFSFEATMQYKSPFVE